LVAAALALALVAVACGGDGDDNDAAARRTTTSASPGGVATAPTLAPGTAPLTGLQADPGKLSRPLLIVKIDNAPKARPQAGMNQADVVIEEAVEGGVTRFAVLFHSDDADPVGPVRSARSTDILIATPLHRPLFAYSGTNATFAAQVASAPLVDLSPNRRPGAYRRQPGRPAPYNLFSSTGAFRSGAEGQPPPPMFAYRAGGAGLDGATAASGAVVEFKGIVVTSAEWTWDASSKTWKRTEVTYKPGTNQSTTRTAHVDAAGAQVAAQNVVIQFVSYHDTGQIDQSGEPVPEADLIGEGEAWVLSDGKVVKGRWRRTSAEAVTEYLDASGAPIRLTPGRTWVELPKPGMGSLK
jgi:hypothetical protein